MKRIALAAVALALGTGAACAKDLWSADQIKQVAEVSNKLYAAQANPQMALEMIPSDTSMKMVLKFADASKFGDQWKSMNEEQKQMITNMMVKQMCDSLTSTSADQNVVAHVDYLDLVLANSDASETFTNVKLTEEVCAAAK